MSAQDKLKEMRVLNGKLAKAYPDLVGSFTTFITKVEGEGALDVKTKELISVSLSVALGCDLCIAYHTKSALDHGATPDELIEACMVATFMAGTPAMMNIRTVLQIIDGSKR